MGSISSGKLLYHLTNIDNVESIINQGILPRCEIDGFVDIADTDILDSRKSLNLEEYVPFHFFARNPFDGRVQADYPNDNFVLFTVRRVVAKDNNWNVVPRHPLSGGIELYDYNEGIAEIDWDKMEERDYSDPECKSICMAECLSPNSVPVEKIFSIFTKDKTDQEMILEHVDSMNKPLHINVNPYMFLKEK